MSLPHIKELPPLFCPAPNICVTYDDLSSVDCFKNVNECRIFTKSSNLPYIVHKDKCPVNYEFIKQYLSKQYQNCVNQNS